MTELLSTSRSLRTAKHRNVNLGNGNDKRQTANERKDTNTISLFLNLHEDYFHGCFSPERSGEAREVIPQNHQAGIQHMFNITHTQRHQTLPSKHGEGIWVGQALHCITRRGVAWDRSSSKG
jgi:hypothetical protein